MKSLSFLLVLLTFGLLLAPSCTDEKKEPVEEDGTQPAVATFVTYNAGLAPGFVAYAEERASLVVDAVAGLDADVVCLQEVWMPEDYQAMEAAGSDFEDVYYEVTEDEVDETGPACSEEEATDLGDCVSENCDGVDPGALAECALDHCSDEFNSLSPDCSGCIVANLGGTIEEILTTCTDEGGGSMAYGGHNGLMILTSGTVISTDVLEMDSHINQRVVLHAHMTIPVAGDVDVYCTHLAANLSDVDYGGDHDSWEGEREYQIGAMNDFVDSTRQGSVPVVMMGDMNCGPETTAVDAEFEENYEIFLSAGFAAPYPDGGDCTWCTENPLTGGADSGGVDSIIDHVFFMDTPEGATFTSSRIFDQEVDLSTTDGDIKSRLSDHYGVSVTIESQLGW